MSSDHHALPHIETEGNFEFTNGKFAMWLLIVSDAMAFIGFLGAYMVLRISAVGEPSLTGLPWQPAWSLPMDLILTGLNTFVLICSSVTMVKALAALQDGNQAGLKKYLAMTMLGGAFFVSFQYYEWTHFVHEGITIQGMKLVDLDTAMTRGAAAGNKLTKLEMAAQMYGKRRFEGTPDAPAALPTGKGAQDFRSGNFTEAEYLFLELAVRDRANADLRPVQGGIIHHTAYGVPGTTNDPKGRTGRELQEELEAAEPAQRGSVIQAHRAAGSRVASLFCSSFYVLTGFHGLHVAVGVLYLGILLIRAFQGAYTRANSSIIEVAGLYWHFVDLVWVLLFMLIYLI
ncbi:MAG: heme-copper oxidase subunit III [Planctomycetes bacterium]|nr:heme-copper oxidase subunit III [Planctomycetota bacterium]